MLGLIALVLATAVLPLPRRSGARRLVPAGARLPRTLAAPAVRCVTAAVGLLGFAAVSLAGGWALGVSCAVVLLGWWARRGDTRRITRTLDVTRDWCASLGRLAADLRSGAHPEAAVRRASVDSEPEVSELLDRVAATVHLGGDVQCQLVRQEPTGLSSDVPTRLGRAWSLASTHGLPLALVLDAVRGDVAHRLRFAENVRARMAGPRATGTLLSALPLLALALGEAVGAGPVAILLSTNTGGLLLVVGAVLVTTGSWWVHHLTTRTVR
ncbi:type II secretion system F family protein [Actinoalloteichus spitiensis]|uniref:type II secretion system F family protein n=1 Tax=Actinoalloteichus spitiensis TaxID=252394 RepID=UPI0012F66FB6|nr:type II secretion system F family protein [Actinoalloteichus spitiensis]